METPIAMVIKEKGLKKTWVAEQAGVSRAAFSLIVKGESEPTLRVALRIAKVLGKSVEELWGYLIEEKESK